VLDPTRRANGTCSRRPNWCTQASSQMPWLCKVWYGGAKKAAAMAAGGKR